MADAKVSVRGTSAGNFLKGKKGDIWSVIPGDWGRLNVAPDWLQVTVTDVPGATNQGEANAIFQQEYLKPYRSGFTVTEPSAGRFRVELNAGLNIGVPVFRAIRDGVVVRFEGSNVTEQNRAWFEFDSWPGTPLDEIAQQIDFAAGDARRFQLDPNIVDNAIGSVASGDPAPYVMPYANAATDIIDKLG